MTPPCGRVPTALRSTHSVSPLRRRPRGLRLMEEVQELPLSELSEGCVGTPGSQRRIASEAALALGAGPELEQQPKLILPINGDAARGINLPDAAVYHDGGSGHTSVGASSSRRPKPVVHVRLHRSRDGSPLERLCERHCGGGPISV